MTGQNDVDIPETGAVFTFGRSGFADNVPSKFWLRNDLPVHLSCGGEHTAVITDNGRLLMFGGNTFGQLGLGVKPVACKPVSARALKSEKVKLVACGRDHTIVHTWQNSVYGAGSNQNGQLGLGHCNNTESFHRLSPVFAGATITMLSAGCNTSAALTEDGRLFMWGDNSVGQIGLADESFAAEPREVNVGEAVVWVSCGFRHSACVTAEGNLYTFGERANGQLGLEMEQLANHRIPQQVHGILGCVTQVSCGGEHTVALTENCVYTFGRGQYGQLGHGTFLFQVDLPKPLEHFWDSSVKHIACGDNHTAVVTNSGLLYTFGDGRHGKLGLEEENFMNRFSPTLSTCFLKYNVEFVSCGGQHMLVLASPRPPEDQLDLPDLESYCTEMKYNQALPLSALAARARHRAKGSPTELFGDIFHILPRLNSDFLNTSWQTSRNIPAPQRLPKGCSSSSSSPKPQSVISPGPPPSPRLLAKSPQSPILSPQPSSPHSQSSGAFQIKSPDKDSPQSGSSELHSTFLSPKSLIKRCPDSPLPGTKIAKRRTQGVAAANKTLIEKLPSPVSPQEHCSPIRPLSATSCNDESLQHSGVETLQSDIAIGDVEGRGADSDLSENTTKTRGQGCRRTAQQQASRKASPTELLKASDPIKQEVCPPKSPNSQVNHKATWKGKENVIKDSNKNKTYAGRQPQKGPSRFQSPSEKKQPESDSLPSARKTPTGAQQSLTEEEDKARRNLKERNEKQEDVIASPSPPSSPSERTFPAVIDDKRNTVKSLSSTSLGEVRKENAGPTNIKPVDTERQIETQRAKSTSATTVHKVKSTLGTGQAPLVKSPPEKIGAAAATAAAQLGMEESLSVKSTPVKAMGTTATLHSTPVQSQRKGERGRSPDKIRGGVADERQAPAVGGSAGKHGTKSELKAQTRAGGEQGGKMKRSDGADPESRPNAGTRASKPASSQQDAPVLNPLRSEAVSIGDAESDLRPVDRKCQEDEEQSANKPGWREVVGSGAALLPAPAIAGASVGVLGGALAAVLPGRHPISDAVTPATPQTRPFTKQHAITQPSFSSTDSSSAEASKPPERVTGAQVNTGEESKQSASNQTLVRSDSSDASQTGERKESDGDNKTGVASEEEEEQGEGEEEGDSGSDGEGEEAQQGGSDSSAEMLEGEEEEEEDEVEEEMEEKEEKQMGKKEVGQEVEEEEGVSGVAEQNTETAEEEEEEEEEEAEEEEHSIRDTENEGSDSARKESESEEEEEEDNEEGEEEAEENVNQAGMKSQDPELEEGGSESGDDSEEGEDQEEEEDDGNNEEDENTQEGEQYGSKEKEESDKRKDEPRSSKSVSKESEETGEEREDEEEAEEEEEGWERVSRTTNEEEWEEAEGEEEDGESDEAEEGEEESSEEDEDTEEEEEEEDSTNENGTEEEDETTGEEDEEEGSEEEDEDESEDESEDEEEDEDDEEEDDEEESEEEEEASNSKSSQKGAEGKTNGKSKGPNAKTEKGEEVKKVTNRKKTGRQQVPPTVGRRRPLPRPPPAARRGEQQRQRPKQASTGPRKAKESQQFWNNVLPQYLGLQ